MLVSVSDKTSHVRASNAIYSPRKLTDSLSAQLHCQAGCSEPSDGISAERSSFGQLSIFHLSVSGRKERVLIGGKQVVMVREHY